MDDADIAAKDQAPCDEATISNIRLAASRIPAGVAGKCIHCDEDSPRLVRGACAPCRDELKLP